VPSGWTAPGIAVYLLGTTRAELDGSAWADVVHDHLGGLPPAVDLAAERRLGAVLQNAARDDLVDAAHDLSEGGLVQALLESSLRFGVGVRVSLDALCERDGVTPFEALFSESTARALVAVPRSEEVRFADLCVARGVPALKLGQTADVATGDEEAGPAVEVEGLFTIPLAEAGEVFEATLPRHFG